MAIAFAIWVAADGLFLRRRSAYEQRLRRARALPRIRSPAADAICALLVEYLDGLRGRPHFMPALERTESFFLKRA